MSLDQQLVTDEARSLSLLLGVLECRQKRLASVLPLFRDLLTDAVTVVLYCLLLVQSQIALWDNANTMLSPSDQLTN